MESWWEAVELEWFKVARGRVGSGGQVGGDGGTQGSGGVIGSGGRGGSVAGSGGVTGGGGTVGSALGGRTRSSRGNDREEPHVRRSDGGYGRRA